MNVVFNSLLNRIRKLEKENKPLMMDIAFEDGSYISLHERQFHRIWDDIHQGLENEIYEEMKAKKDQGIIDSGGLIYLMEAEDPNLNTGLWDEN
jgi:hypothetical protein